MCKLYRSGDERKTKCVVVADEVKRHPLSVICSNISPAIGLEGGMLSKKSDGARNGFSCETLLIPVVKAECSERIALRDAYSSKTESNGEGFYVNKVGFSLKDGSILSPCSTPPRQQDRSYECDSSSESNLIRAVALPDTNVCASISHLLDDDFDESFLEQIDALCEQKLSDNPERKNCAMERLENDFVIKSCEDDKSTMNVNVTSETLESGEICSSAEGESSGSKELGKSGRKQTKNMPEEYTTYIQSLNDRQQEAACSDTSIPLVIVAGPGSGKVYLSLIFGNLSCLFFNDLSICFVCQTSTMVGRVLVLLSEVSPSYVFLS